MVAAVCPAGCCTLICGRNPDRRDRSVSKEGIMAIQLHPEDHTAREALPNLAERLEALLLPAGS
jgi:hypothetical protein